MEVSRLLHPKSVLLRAKIENFSDALGILVELQESAGVITNGTACYNAVYDREISGGSTAIGEGIALPHASNAGVSAPGISAMTLRRGIEWGAADNRPVDLLFMVAVPPDHLSEHVQILARLVNLLAMPDLVAKLRSATTVPEFLQAMRQAEHACFAQAEETAPQRKKFFLR